MIRNDSHQDLFIPGCEQTSSLTSWSSGIYNAASCTTHQHCIDTKKSLPAGLGGAQLTLPTNKKHKKSDVDI